MTGTCLVIDGGSPFAEATIAALTPLYTEVLRAAPSAAATRSAWPELTFDPADEAGWDAMSAATLHRHGPVDAIIACAPPARTDGEDLIMRNWFALRESVRLLPEGASGVFLSQHLAPDAAHPEREAALEGQRMGMAATILDAIGMERRPRVNRLVAAPNASPAAVTEAVRYLCDTRSSFMNGAEIALDATPSEGNGRLDGRTVLITGATSGLGRAAAIEAGKLGAFVAVGGRKISLAEETLTMVRAAGGDGMVAPLDVTDASAWAKAIASVMEKRGALHALVNNAGENVNRRIDQLQASDVAFLRAVNYRGVMLGMAAAEPALKASGGGAIVNVSSVAGIRGGPGASAYSTTKAAQIGYSLSRGRVLAQESPRIRVNAFQPGLIWSDSVANSLGEAGATAFRARIEPQTPLGRVTDPVEVARSLVWLLTEAAAPVAAQAIHVSGGLELNFP